MHHRIVGTLLGLVSLVGIGAVVSCSSSTATTGDTPEAGPAPVTPPATEAGTGCTADPGAPAGTVDANAATDPTGGADKFTLAMALAGFPDSKGKLIATINTEKSLIKCELDEKAAPISVANFVGLARGTRPYKSPAGKWKLGHFYDGLVWHRVVPDFVIQGGDPDGDGTGGPGYDLVKENQLEEPLGTLAQAASKAPSGSQFYIVVGTGPKPNYNVYGKCDTDVAKAIAAVDRDRNDAPKTPVHILKVDISRCP